MTTTDPIILLNYEYPVGKDRLWNALTQHAEMTQWYFPMLPAFQTQKGFSTGFLIQHEGYDFHHQWTVTDVRDGEYIAYRWQMKGYDGISVSHFTLSGDENKSQLELRIEILEDFDQSIGPFRRESGLAGWKYLLGEALVEYLKP